MRTARDDLGRFSFREERMPPGAALWDGLKVNDLAWPSKSAAPGGIFVGLLQGIGQRGGELRRGSAAHSVHPAQAARALSGLHCVIRSTGVQIGPREVVVNRVVRGDLAGRVLPERKRVVIVRARRHVSGNRHSTSTRATGNCSACGNRPIPIASATANAISAGYVQ